MSVSLKCQYALRALFELARRDGDGLVRLTEIAAKQAIPGRFLENILNQLRQGGFVDSKRGKDGGFVLARPAAEITVGDIIRFIEGPINPVDCVSSRESGDCPLKGSCIFLNLWSEVTEALESVYDRKTLRDLVDEDKRICAQGVDNYSI